ncbi:hypothetical protein [Sneathia sanguinegens]|uniref:hypothetical protein n=1 Tax=Sneathia sanguinegens TaxID=40543 RepID=UPI00288BE8C3|nr:hypothetical protein [Sneathia sanguinegens]
MNIENAESLVHLVGKRVQYKKDNLTYTAISFEKYIKAMNAPKVLYKLILKNKFVFGSSTIEIVGNEHKLISKLREFEIAK